MLSQTQRLATRTMTTSSLARMAPRIQPNRVATQQRRHAGTGGKDAEPDMGGPGGQEQYPETQPIHRKYAGITVAGVLVAGGVMYTMKKKNVTDTNAGAA
ncbi:hypothetical protein B0H66DRAFT_644163 [Apodospora peruviana]|uniref:Uncharacterized protein n=1 Tax=Apodospora peruviana TaxID=516989 RepID=A0AAE0HUN5_9PEZI|nr:hypothetical protein B0H66DRAFT_644163 [Apodospora peruviana]